MSMSFWTITGFGIENIEDWVSEEKINRIAGTSEWEIDLIEYASEYYDYNNEKCFYFTDNGEGEVFFLYSPNLPFEMKEQEKAFTCKDDIAIAMYEDLKDILKDNITVEDFKNKIDWVSACGAG